MNEEQAVNHYMKMKFSEWPESLYETLQNVSKHQGFCGEVAVDTIRAWHKNPVVMQYPEVSAIWEEMREGGDNE